MIFHVDYWLMSTNRKRALTVHGENIVSRPRNHRKIN